MECYYNTTNNEGYTLEGVRGNNLWFIAPLTPLKKDLTPHVGARTYFEEWPGSALQVRLSAGMYPNRQKNIILLEKFMCIRIGTCSPTPVSPTPISPTPISPTLDQKVAFYLHTPKKINFGHQCDVKVMSTQHPEVGLSLKIYLGHVKVTSCAMTGFVCTN